MFLGDRYASTMTPPFSIGDSVWDIIVDIILDSRTTFSPPLRRTEDIFVVNIWEERIIVEGKVCDGGTH